MKVVYIAGKYRAPTPWGVEQNIQAAREVAARVVQAGHMPLCPHTNTAHMEGLADDAFFLAGTLELLRRCDAVVMVPGWESSHGARAEREEAQRLGMPVFGDLRHIETELDFEEMASIAVGGLEHWAQHIAAKGQAWVRGTIGERRSDDAVEVNIGMNGYDIMCLHADVRPIG